MTFPHFNYLTLFTKILHGVVLCCLLIAAVVVVVVVAVVAVKTPQHLSQRKSGCLVRRSFYVEAHKIQWEIPI